MTRYRTLPVVLASTLFFMSSAHADPTITKDMQTYCINDYKKYCGDYGLQSKALSNCMYRNGKSLSPACVKALVASGQVSQAQVEKLKQQAKGRAEPK